MSTDIKTVMVIFSIACRMSYSLYHSNLILLRGLIF